MKQFFNALFDTVKNCFLSLVSNGHDKYYDVADNKSSPNRSNSLSDYFSEKFKFKADVQIERGALWLIGAFSILVLSLIICGKFKKRNR